MDERWGFWIFVAALIMIMFMLNFYTCLGGCYYRDKNYANQIYANNQQTRVYVYDSDTSFSNNDFCSINNINNYFPNKNSCCNAKMSCGNGLRGHWNSGNNGCEC